MRVSWRYIDVELHNVRIHDAAIRCKPGPGWRIFPGVYCTLGFGMGKVVGVHQPVASTRFRIHDGAYMV